MQTRHRTDLTKGPITKQLIALTIPVFLSTLLQLLYTSADRAVAGLYGGQIALAAVGSTGTATNLLLALFNGLSAGATVVISNFLGARKEQDKRTAMHTSILLAAICGLFMGGAGVFLSKPILQLMSAPADVLGKATVYMQIYLAGSPFSLVFNFGAAILRSHGDNKRPTWILIITGLLNVVLNLFFVIVCGIPVAGVALATIISQAASAVWVLIILFNPKDEYQMSTRELTFDKKNLATIVRIGVPCGINTMLFSLANMILQSTINTFGSVEVAGGVAADSVNNLNFAISAALYTSCVTFSGQCYGARKFDRLTKLLRTGLLIGTLVGLVCTAVCMIFPEPLLKIFAKEPGVIAAGAQKLSITCLTIAPYSCSQVLMGVLRGMRRSTGPTVLNIFSICLPRLLWIFFVFPFCPTIRFLYICVPISNILNTLVLAVYYFIERKKLYREVEL